MAIAWRLRGLWVWAIEFRARSFRRWVTDGTRTRDVQDHNLALYQLSYGYQLNIRFLQHLRR
jgi:hypothetical protein